MHVFMHIRAWCLRGQKRVLDQDMQGCKPHLSVSDGNQIQVVWKNS